MTESSLIGNNASLQVFIDNATTKSFKEQLIKNLKEYKQNFLTEVEEQILNASKKGKISFETEHEIEDMPWNTDLESFEEFFREKGIECNAKKYYLGYSTKTIISVTYNWSDLLKA